MRCYLMLFLLAGPLVAAEVPKGQKPKAPLEEQPKEYAKVELRGQIAPDGEFLIPGVLIINISNQKYELNFSRMKSPPKKEDLVWLEGKKVFVQGALLLPREGINIGGKLPKTPLVIVTKLMVVFE